MKGLNFSVLFWFIQRFRKIAEGLKVDTPTAGLEGLDIQKYVPSEAEKSLETDAGEDWEQTEMERTGVYEHSYHSN